MVVVNKNASSSVIPRLPVSPLSTLVEQKTLEALERRRRTRVPTRGWGVRRMLLLADVLGVTAAFGVTEGLAFRGLVSSSESMSDLALFVATLPVWIVIARLYGLYSRDEERTDDFTVDDLAGVFHMVTLGRGFS